MARLEFMHFETLEDSEYGIPNLEQEITSSPKLYFQAIGITYKRSDEASAADEAHINELAKNDDVVIQTHRLLKRLARIPGTNKDGEICFEELRDWVLEVRELCQNHARAEIGDVMIGELLSKSLSDGAVELPPAAVCRVLEEVSSQCVEDGFFVGVRNSRGVVWRDEGGRQEHVLAASWLELAQEVSGEYVVVGRLLKRIAKSYQSDAHWQDTEAKVRDRVGE